MGTVGGWDKIQGLGLGSDSEWWDYRYDQGGEGRRATGAAVTACSGAAECMHGECV